MKRRTFLAASAALLAAPSVSIAAPSPHMRVTGPAHAPREWLMMAADRKIEPRPPISPLEYSTALFRDLVRTNTAVNSLGVAKREPVGGDWTSGGCTGAAWAKRGWLHAIHYIDESHLRLAICKTEKHLPYADHMCLIVNTTAGDYALDVNAKDVRLWHTLPYSWVMRLAGDSYSWEMLAP